MTTIERRSTIEPAEFKAKYIDGNKPVVLTGMSKSWPAMSKWTLEYFAELKSTEVLRTEVGNTMQGQTELARMEFRDYVRGLIEDESAHEYSGYAEEKPYLAYWNIFDTFPDLEGDVDFSLIGQFKRGVELSGWIGPAGSLTGWHWDYADNIFTQISGVKRFDLVSPDQGDKMYTSKKFGRGAMLSDIDASQDIEKFPDFADVKVETAVLGGGDMLFIPVDWWHRVEGLTSGIGVNGLGFTWAEEFTLARNTWRAKSLLHVLGIYGMKHGCVCCKTGPDGKRIKVKR